MSGGHDADILYDVGGRPLLLCARCDQPLSIADLIGQDLRLPEQNESRDDYLDAELLDDMVHISCNGMSRSA